MLGWALKKGFQGATGLRDAHHDRGDDTTQLDVPDTPAPVFAARAIKNALWGQSAAVADDLPTKSTKPSEPQRVKSTTGSTTTNTTTPASTAEKTTSIDARSPSKLNSILLTPGMGASRRKRVSFGRDVKAGNNVEPSPFTSSATRDGKQRKKTALQKVLEDARSAERKVVEAQPEYPQVDNPEEEWEWDDEDACCNHDVTVDLNEPHSESGKYWKDQWARYREEAKSDIEQLVKYKAKARSFAAKKDTEASQLTQKLKEEQAKVAELEKKIADLNATLTAARKHGTNEDNAALIRDLGKQTSLAAEYRERVKALEAGIKEASNESNANSSSRRRIDASPLMEQSIIDTSRELRKARADLRQLDRLRDEVRRLKSNLATSRERVAELEDQASDGAVSESSQVKRLEKELRDVREESRQKDTEIRKLKRDYESLKRDAKSRMAEAMQVSQEKNDRIDELEEEIKNLKTTNSSNQPRDIDTAIAEHNRITRDLKSDIESLSRPSKYEKARTTNGHARAVPVQDDTLDAMERSLRLHDKDGDAPYENRQGKGPSDGVLTDWTADIPTLELQKQEKYRHDGAEKLNKSVFERTHPSPRWRAARSARQRARHGNVRGSSDGLPNRANQSSSANARRYQQPSVEDAMTTDLLDANFNPVASNAQSTVAAEDKSIAPTAIDRSSRRPRNPRTARSAPSRNETPANDVVEDQFSRPEGLSADPGAMANTPRRNLPADRQAAALARIEQKRMNRRKANGQDLDKENVGP